MLGPVRDSEIARANVERSKIDKQIRALRSKRNDLAPISRLPPEVLSKIFLYCRWAPAPPREEPKRRRPYNRDDWDFEEPFDDDLLSSEGSKPGKSAIDWHHFTFVSRRWRAIALKCTSLWTTISTDCSASWARLMLQRSQRLPLCVSMERGVGNMLNNWPFKVLSNTQRLRNLTVSQNVKESNHIDNYIRNLATPAPLLETLSLAYMDSSRPDDFPLKTLPESFLAEEAPRLRRLSLTQWVPASWNSRLFNNLTHLTIHLLTTGAVAVAPFPGNVLLDILERISALERLDLSMRLPEVYDDSCSGRVVPLLTLKELVLSKARLKPLAKLLDHTRLNANTRVNVTVSCTSEDDQHAASGIKEFASSLDSSWITGPSMSTHPRPPLVHLFIPGLNCIYVSALYVSRTASVPPERADGDLLVWVYREPGEKVTEVGKLWEVLPLSQLQRLSVGEDGAEEQFESMARFSTVRHLTLPNLSACFLKYLVSDSTPDFQSRFFPALEEITFNSDVKEQSADSLIYFLQFRKELGRPILRINIVKELVSEGDVNRIEALCDVADLNEPFKKQPGKK
ncbi:hypothetical protein BKA70DRAFT_339601 [Coprinopsis sp. MPI-PUGE-AT-0042]|nr:hypothetical protein BKA70DRAFT_339601 [Coprinopsis sp. MPI-PUGE-AT-0042]